MEEPEIIDVDNSPNEPCIIDLASTISGETIDLTGGDDEAISIPASASARTPKESTPGRITLKCSICLDSITKLASTTCGHVFCIDCIKQAVRTARKCPLCKKSLKLKDIHPLYV